MHIWQANRYASALAYFAPGSSKQSYIHPKNLKNNANSKTTIAQNTRGCCLKNCLDCAAKVYTGTPYAVSLSSLRMFAGLILLA